jgi:alkylation response protein AidB-like acyl-CoA dehydrogenase
MPVALSEEHRAMAAVARSFVNDVDAAAAARQALDAPDEELPAFWKGLASLGWIGLAVPERHGGQGYGLLELAVIVEELGGAVAPGPFLPTALAATVLGLCGGDEQLGRRLPGLCDGSVVASVGLADGLRREGDLLEGETSVLGGGLADLFLLPVGDDMVILDRLAGGVSVHLADSLDRTRRMATVSTSGLPMAAADVLVGARPVAECIGRLLAAAEAAGMASACTRAATAYAQVREQFGRPIGTFQAVKHHCANMLVDAELATAAAWDAARGPASEMPLRSALAATAALPAAVRCAQRLIQVLGGIGYTWEHDAHLFLRRATTTLAVFGGTNAAPAEVTAAVRAGDRLSGGVDLPPEAEVYREEVRAFRERLLGLPDGERRAALVDAGYYVPHFPPPFGRGAGPVEQLVIEEELGELGRTDLGIGTWILPTLIQHATEEQLQRWVRPSLYGHSRWCQLFSEPNAGSDAAAITTRGRRVEGGWVVSGQKVWTSDARICDRGLATVRTDPEAPKHAGVTMLAIDMHAPGVQVRPLREITGETLFNEVFFDDVFVPDADVVGPVGGGWIVARATLGNERVTIGGGQSAHSFQEDELVDLLERYAPDDIGLAREVGRMIAEAWAMRAMNLRNVERSIVGEDPGPEGNITKLLSAEHAQRVTELGAAIASLAVTDGREPTLTHDLLFTRCLSIAGGTSEISRNQIAERLLGLPRDPMLRR